MCCWRAAPMDKHQIKENQYQGDCLNVIRQAVLYDNIIINWRVTLSIKITYSSMFGYDFNSNLSDHIYDILITIGGILRVIIGKIYLY